MEAKGTDEVSNVHQSCHGWSLLESAMGFDSPSHPYLHCLLPMWERKKKCSTFQNRKCYTLQSIASTARDAAVAALRRNCVGHDSFTKAHEYILLVPIYGSNAFPKKTLQKYFRIRSWKNGYPRWISTLTWARMRSWIVSKRSSRFISGRGIEPRVVLQQKPPCKVSHVTEASISMS